MILRIEDLRPTQIYLSQRKIANVLEWFHSSAAQLDPVSVRDFLGNDSYYITDGHSRTYAAWIMGRECVPCVYDDSSVVIGVLGQRQYENDIQWCNRFKIAHISHLRDRIVSEETYEALWQNRCSRMYDLEVALLNAKIDRSDYERMKMELSRKGIFIYGISEDLGTMYCENALGELFDIPFG